MKKAQVFSQIFVYVLAIILISFVLVYGYNAIQNFRERAVQISCIKFQNDLKNAVSSISNDYGSVIRKDLQLCRSYTKVCFVETYTYPNLPSDVDPIIKDSILSYTGKNVFLVDRIAKESFFAGNISVENNGVLCVPPVNNVISLRLEGKGNHVFVSQWK